MFKEGEGSFNQNEERPVESQEQAGQINVSDLLSSFSERKVSSVKKNQRKRSVRERNCKKILRNVFQVIIFYRTALMPGKKV